MRRFRIFPAVAALFLALTLTSCAEDPVSPSPAAVPADNPDELLGSLVGGLLGTTTSLVNGVLACPSSETYTATKTIGYYGGTIEVGPHRLYIPYGALESPVTITATAPAGPVTTLSFEPHGLQFERSTALTMSYAHCGLVSGLTKRVVYVDGQLNILEVLPSLNDLWRRQVTGKLDHFSAYAVAE